MNEVQGLATFHVLYKTNMSVEEFLHKFNENNIIDQKVVVTLSDGTQHTFQVYEYIAGLINSFVVNDEEIVEEDIDMKNIVEIKEKVTKLDSVTKIAL